MNENDFLIKLFELFKGGNLAGVLLFAVLLKKYVINGSIERYFAARKSEVDALLRIEKKLERMMRERRNSKWNRQQPLPRKKSFFSFL